MATKITYLAKDQIQTFDLFGAYWIFLISLQKEYKEMLEKILGTTVTTWIESDFFDKDGKKIGDRPDMEEIYFQIPGNPTKARVDIYHGDTFHPRIELVKDDDQNYYEQRKDFEKTHAYLFSERTMKIVAKWIESGKLDSIAYPHFQEAKI